MQIRIHSIISGSKVNGPGNRYVLWMQGCNRKCWNCYNMSLKKKNGGYLTNIEKLCYDILRSKKDGITITGGEPFEQPKPLLELLKILNSKISQFTYGIICFTGYTIEEIMEDPAKAACVELIDLIIEGRYQKEKQTISCLAGSRNQRFIWLNKEGRGKDLIATDSVQEEHNVEIHIDDTSPYMTITGFPNIDENKLKNLGISFIEED